MKCLETRNRKGIKWRRYRTETGERFTSMEIPEVVVKKLIRRVDLVQAMKEFETSNQVLTWKKDKDRYE